MTLDDDLLRELLDEALASDRRTARLSERSLRSQAEEDADLQGTLLDLGERAAVVTVRTLAGRPHTGTVLAVGSDFVAVGEGRAAPVLIRLDGLSTVQPLEAGRHDAPTGQRPPPVDVRLLEVLAQASPRRPRVRIVTRSGEAVTGELRSVGAGVVTVALEGGGHRVCYVSAGSISEAALLRSG